MHDPDTRVPDELAVDALLAMMDRRDPDPLEPLRVETMYRRPPRRGLRDRVLYGVGCVLGMILLAAGIFIVLGVAGWLVHTAWRWAF